MSRGKQIKSNKNHQNENSSWTFGHKYLRLSVIDWFQLASSFVTRKKQIS